MEKIIFACFMIPLALLFTALGIFAWTRKKPMWFWAGSTVKQEEITDVRAYNRANGIMWLSFSLVYWTAVVVGFFKVTAAGIIVGAGTLAGIPVLIGAYALICKKYKARKNAAD